MFQSIDRISVELAGMVNWGKVIGFVSEAGMIGALRSNMRIVPSIEQDAMMSGSCGEKSAW